jgi:hypothetical protein
MVQSLQSYRWNHLSQLTRDLVLLSFAYSSIPFGNHLMVHLDFQSHNTFLHSRVYIEQYS